MKSLSRFILLSPLGLLFVNPYFLYAINAVTELGWTSDGSTLDDWEQMNGDEHFDSDGLYTDDIEVVNGEFAALKQSDQTLWWDAAPADVYRYAGIFREESFGLAAPEWEYTLTVDLNNAQQTLGSSTFKGYFRLFIFNANKEPMLRINVVDPAGSTGLTYTRIEYIHWDSNGTNVRGMTDDFVPLINIQDGLMGIKKNSTGIFWIVPFNWVNPTTGDWIYWGTADALLTRGVPTFLAVDVLRKHRRPTEWDFDNITFRFTGSPSPRITPGWQITYLLIVLPFVILIERRKKEI